MASRHRPERTLLYRLVEQYYPTFKSHLASSGSHLPRYVEQEFEAFLKGGQSERPHWSTVSFACVATVVVLNISLSPAARSGDSFGAALGPVVAPGAWPKAGTGPRSRPDNAAEMGARMSRAVRARAPKRAVSRRVDKR